MNPKESIVLCLLFSFLKRHKKETKQQQQKKQQKWFINLQIFLMLWDKPGHRAA